MCQDTAPKDEAQELYSEQKACISPNWNVGLCFLMSKSSIFSKWIIERFYKLALTEPIVPEKVIQSLHHLVSTK